MDNKYELVRDNSINYRGRTLYRIRALKDFNDVKKGDLGGYIENECNLDQGGDCWVDENALVYGNAKISDNARVFNRAIVYGNARVSDNAIISGNARLFDHARVYDNAEVYENAWVCDDARVFGNALVSGNARIAVNAKVYGNAMISANARVYGNAEVFGIVEVSGNAVLEGNAIIKSLNDYLVFKNNWSNGRYFTYTKSNKMWKVGLFYGTGDELIKKAYKDSKESGDKYKATVQYAESIMN